MRNKRSRKLVSILITLTMLVTLLVPMVGPASASATYSMTNVQKVVAKTPTVWQGIGSLVISMDQSTFIASAGKYVYLSLPNSPTGYQLATSAAVTCTGGGTGVTASATSDPKQIIVNVAAGATATDDVKISVPLQILVPSGVTGDIKMNLDAPGSSTFTSGSLVIATVGTSTGTIASESVPAISSANNQPLGVIDIKESAAASIVDSGSAAMKLTLPPGFKWSGVPGISIMWGNITLNPAQFTTTNNDGRELTINVSTAQESTSGSFIKLTGSVDVDESVAKLGDVTVTVSGATTTTPSSIVVAKYGDYGATVSGFSKTEVIPGKAAVDIGKLAIEESVPGSFIVGRTVTLTLPSNARWSQMPNIDSDNSSNMGGLGLSWGTVGSDGRVIKGTFTGTDTRGATDPAKIVFKDMQITTAIDFTGDMKVTVAGSQGLDGDINLADVASGIKVTAEGSNEVKIGVQGQSVGDITIAESKSETIEGTETLSTVAASGIVTTTTPGVKTTLVVKAPAGVTFDTTPTVTVDGDLTIDNSGVKVDKTDANEGILYIPIKSSSTAASTIKISGMKVTADRTIPEGQLIFNIQGDAVNETYTVAPNYSSADTLVFTGHKNAASVAVANVVTPAPSDEKSTAVFKIGDTKFTMGGAEQTLDAAPYIKSDRTYLPIRFVAKAVGVADSNIMWNADEQSVVMVKGDRVVKLVIGSTNMLINGVAVTMDAAPEVVDPGRTMLPVRWVAQALGANIQWDAATQTVTIN